MMLDVLDDIYNCDFRRITNLVAEGVTDNLKFAGKVQWSAAIVDNQRTRGI